MRYVMVPVPTEFVLDVMRMVLFRAPDEADSSGMLDEARLRRLMTEADDLTKALVLLVAKAAVDDKTVKFSDAADELDEDPEVLRAVLRELNVEAFGPGRELIAVTDEVAVRVQGNRGTNRCLVMRPDHARCVRLLERNARQPGA